MTNCEFVRLVVTRWVSHSGLNIHWKCDTAEVMLGIYEFSLFHSLLLTFEKGKQLLVFLAGSPNSF